MPNYTDDEYFCVWWVGSLLSGVLILELILRFPPAQVSSGFSDLSSVALFSWRHVQYERAGITLFSLCGCCETPQEKMSNHCRGNKKQKDAFVLGGSYLSLSAVMDDNLGVECVCLSIAAVQSDQGQAPTEKGPVPQLMSSIIQMESLLSVHCALVHTLLSQAASSDAPLPHFDALSLYRLLKCIWENKAPSNWF